MNYFFNGNKKICEHSQKILRLLEGVLYLKLEFYDISLDQKNKEESSFKYIFICIIINIFNEEKIILTSKLT